jgi:RND family efflux transporter MFP subunit
MTPRTVFLPLALAAALAGCSQGPPKVEMPPPVVFYAEPVEADVTDYSDFTGRTAAVESVQVRARVWGYLDKINFVEGGLVKKDDVLFEIDPSTYATAVNQAEARVKLADATLNQAQLDAERNRLLRARNAVSQEDLEKSLTARDTAAASLDAAKADLRRVDLDLRFTKVRAPVDGRVGRAMVTRGNLVQSGEMGGTVLTTIVSVDPMWAYFDVDDLTYQQVKGLLRRKDAAGADVPPPVELGLAGEQDFPHLGVIDFVDNQVDPNTGTVRMRGRFGNDAGVLAQGTALGGVTGHLATAGKFLNKGVLTPGLFAQIHLPLGRAHKAILVSDRAVDTDQGVKVVYVVNKDNVVEKRLVQLGKVHNNLREILPGTRPGEGVKPGERVIVEGIQRVRGGDKADPQKMKDEG